MGKISKLAFLMGLILLSVIPAFAYTDLSSYTIGGGYVTPAYGKFLGGYYMYYKTGYYWTVYGDTYETLGVYKVYETNNDDTYVHLQGYINSPLVGNIYICAEGCGLTSCSYIGRDDYINTNVSFQSINELNLQDSVICSGHINIYMHFVSDVGLYFDSYKYEAWWNPEDSYFYKRFISITTASNMSGNVLTITLNNTNFSMINGSADLLNDYNIFYDNDGNETTLSGTLSKLLFTDVTGKEAYPYYIDTFRGGFYNYSRNTTNSTIIKILIPDAVTSAGIYMYYNPKPASQNDTYQGYYNNYAYAHDSNNNPFVIYQVFDDLRWSEIFANNTIIQLTTNDKCSYNRNFAYDGHLNPSYYWLGGGCASGTYRFRNEINSFYISDGFTAATHGGGSYTIHSNLTSFLFRDRQTNNNIRLYNTSGDYVYNNSTSNSIIRVISFLNGYIYENDIGISNNLNISESLNIISFSNFTSSALSTSYSGESYVYIKSFKDKNNISSTNTISDQTNTSYISASIIFTPNNPIHAFSNAFTIAGQIHSYSGGTLTCSLTTGQAIGSLIIPDDSVFNGSVYTGTYNFNFAYVYPYANFTNLTELNYTCNFASSGSSFTTSVYTITVIPMLFVNRTSPASYQNYQSNILVKEDYTYLYNNTGNSFNVGASTWLCDCNLYYNGICYQYGSSCNPISTFLDTPYGIPGGIMASFSSFIDWLAGFIGLAGFAPDRPGILFNINANQLQPNGTYYLVINYNIQNMTWNDSSVIDFVFQGQGAGNNTIPLNPLKPSISQGLSQCIPFDSMWCNINYDPSLCLLPVMTYANFNVTQNQTCITALERQDPLRYFAASMYQQNILGKDELGDFLYGVVFSFVFNFWFVILVIGISTGLTTKHTGVSTLFMFMAAEFFSYAGWLGLLTFPVFNTLIFLGIFVYTIRQH